MARNEGDNRPWPERLAEAEASLAERKSAAEMAAAEEAAREAERGDGPITVADYVHVLLSMPQDAPLVGRDRDYYGYPVGWLPSLEDGEVFIG